MASLFKKAMGISLLTLISRILGYIRDMLLAFTLGASIFNDAFIIALRLPNMFRAIFGEGALSNTFIPIYSNIKDQIAAALFTARVRNLLLVSLLILTIICEIFMPYVVGAIAPGIIAETEVYTLAILFSRLSFSYLLFITITALYGGALNSHDKFMPFASAPIIFNGVLVLMMFIDSRPESIGFNLSLGISIAGILQLLWICLWSWYYKIYLPLGDFFISHNIKLMFKRMLPVIFTSGLLQINVITDTIFASMQVSAISYLYYATRISQLPLALIGISIGTVMLPTLSRCFTEDIKRAHTLQNEAIKFCTLFCIPATIALVFLSHDIIALLLEHGNFDAESTAQTSLALMAYGLGLPAWIFFKLMIANFHSRGDTHYTFKISLIALIINIILNALLFFTIGFYGIALASSIAIFINVACLAHKAHKLGYLRIEREVYILLIKSTVASILMLATIKTCTYLLVNTKIIILCSFFVGFCVYCISLLAMRVKILHFLRL